MKPGTYRRFFGLIMGSICGLALGIVSQTINHLLMPSVPLYQPPFGGAINTLLCFVLGSIFGSITSWPEVGVKGVALGSLLSGLLVAWATLFTGQTDTAALSQKSLILILILAQLLAFFSPVFMLFRWIVSREEMQAREAEAGFKTIWLRRWGYPVMLVFVFALAGLFTMQNKMARSVLPQMHAMIQAGQQTQSIELLPEPLQSKDVTHFLEQGKGEYELDWEKDEHNRFNIKRPLADLNTQSTVIARFKNGYLLVCKFPNETGRPNCKDF